jgi:hypothetical protein
MPRGSSSKRERQYEHIKASAKQRGESTGRAKEIAARTVNKERARSGEAKTASPTSTMDMSSSQRGGQRSHRGTQSPTYVIAGSPNTHTVMNAKRLHDAGSSQPHKQHPAVPRRELLHRSGRHLPTQN